MRVFYHEQGSDEWLQSRCGVITASNFHKLVTTKGERAKGLTTETYINTLIAENDYKEPIRGYVSKDMEEGSRLESDARIMAEVILDVEIKQVGFYCLDDYDIGCSPDGLWSDTGIEIKAPKRSTHIGYKRAKKLPTAYFQQVQGTMAVLELEYYYFMSYRPEHSPFFIKVGRDDKWIEKALDILKDTDQQIKYEQELL